MKIQELVEEMIEDQKENWELAKKNYEALEENLEKAKELEVEEDDIEMVFRIFPQPSTRPLHYGKNGYPLHSGKTMFLMRKESPCRTNQFAVRTL